MPRRNLYLLLAVALVSVVCYLKTQRNRYGQIVADVMDEVQRRYVDPVPGSTLFEGAVEGMLSRLDENSGFISPQALPELEAALSQQFQGVGMEIALDPDTKRLTVISPLFGAPAYEAGIRAGDRILRIDGQSTEGMKYKEAIDRIRGKPGEAVTVTVLHEGAHSPVEIRIVRAIIHVETVLGDTRNSDGSWNFFLQGEDRIGYVRITSFGEKTSHELTEALRWLTERHMRGLILDLRDNPGGLLDEAVQVCDALIDKGVIVTTRGRGGVIKKSYLAAGSATVPNGPMAVLVNQHSASASEIVAACLQDHGRAVIVGQRTYGKGTVQELIPLGDGQGAMKLTTSSYWRPSGHDIRRPKNAGDKDDWGVTPDRGYEVVVQDHDEKQKDKPPVDRPLAKAVEYLRSAAGAKR